MIGLNWGLSPVCDINNNPNNPVINLRAWGEDWETVRALTCAFHRGVIASNVLTCAKHFPGHGNSQADSHLELPIINNDLSNYSKIIPCGIKDKKISNLIELKNEDFSKIYKIIIKNLCFNLKI